MVLSVSGVLTISNLQYFFMVLKAFSLKCFKDFNKHSYDRMSEN